MNFSRLTKYDFLLKFEYCILELSTDSFDSLSVFPDGVQSSFLFKSVFIMAIIKNYFLGLNSQYTKTENGQGRNWPQRAELKFISRPWYIIGPRLYRVFKWNSVFLIAEQENKIVHLCVFSEKGGKDNIFLFQWILDQIKLIAFKILISTVKPLYTCVTIHATACKITEVNIVRSSENEIHDYRLNPYSRWVTELCFSHVV